MNPFFLMVSIGVLEGKRNNMLDSQDNNDHYLVPYHYINLIAQLNIFNDKSQYLFTINKVYTT